jgi:hypothetical protein
MAGIYCGSNSLNPQLVANGGVKTIGSRHQCLRKGIGQGLHMPLDLGYNSPYQAIDPRRFYCGDSAVLPAGYTANGTLQQCFNTGIGVGRRQLAQRAIAGGAAGGVLALAPPIAGVPGGVVAPPIAGVPGGVVGPPPVVAPPIAAVPVGIVAPPGGVVGPPIAAVPVGVVAPKHFLYYILVFLLANAVFIISFLYARPSFIETKDKEINWAVFSPYIAIFALVSAAILYRIYIL